MTDIRMLEKQIVNYVTENNQLPNSLSDLTTIGTINDPWGNPYQYQDTQDGKAPGIRKNMSDNPLNHDFDLYSMGADGQSQSQCNAPKSQDDVVRGYEGRYVGLVSDL
jgi:general secretion pathway protein G